MQLQKTLFFLIVAHMALSWASSNVDSLKPSVDLSLLNFMSRSRNIIQRNPVNAMSCSDYYMPLINGIILEYEQNSKVCSDNAKLARSDAEAATAEEQEQLGNRADSACEQVILCKDGDSAKSSLQCYVEGGSKASKSLRGLSNDASIQSSALNEALRRIDSEENRCITDNRLQYEKDSSDMYDQFSDCIYGITPVPTTPSAPAAP